MLPPIRFALLTVCLIVGLVGLLGCSGDAYGCPPAAQQFSAGCQVQAQQLRQQVIVAPQAVYAAPLIQQQVVAPYYQQQFVQQVVAAQHIAQPVIVQQVRQHRQAIVVQQVRQPRVQVQRSVIRTR